MTTLTMAGAPSLDVSRFVSAVAKRLGAGNDADMQELQRQADERFKQDLDMSHRIARVFETPDGAAVLDWLVEHTLVRPEVEASHLLELSRDQVLNHALMRAGENRIVNMILLAIVQARPAPLGRKHKTRKRSAQ